MIEDKALAFTLERFALSIPIDETLEEMRANHEVDEHLQVACSVERMSGLADVVHQRIQFHFRIYWCVRKQVVNVQNSVLQEYDSKAHE